MLLRQLFDHETSTYTYLLADPSTRDAAIIDPVLERTERDLRLLSELGLTLRYSLDTHVHADHVTGSGVLRDMTGAQSIVSTAAAVGCVGRGVEHGDHITFGAITLEVRSTPGHTNGCVTYVTRDGSVPMAFTGDALLVRGCGRTDFQQGDAGVLYRSVHEQIFTLPPETVLYPGHDYAGFTSTTVWEEQAFNRRLNDKVSEAEFVEIMRGLNLAEPARMSVAVEANLACGKLPQGLAKPDHDFQQVPPADVGDLERWFVVDVREPDELSGPLGQLRDAVSAPLATVPFRAHEWDRSRPVLVVCRSGRRSGIACASLVDLGFEQVSNLEGGMQAWRDFNASDERRGGQ